ncbi:MAG TPA: DUF488 domain-containing protein [Pirellulales bacterium]|jgi:uncharacterized protein (DUF488 family)|nr:DUF488 domain-containing protein [Pirellulales bacterium]
MARKSSTPERVAEGEVRPTVWTIGHSTRTSKEFVALLRAHRITRVVDVRKLPGSRRHPQFNQTELAATLAAEGILYSHLPGLGGLRRGVENSPNGAWRNKSFRAFADYMQTDAFQAALRPVLEWAVSERPALMCAEAVPWQCHRSLIADALVAAEVPVWHIMTATRADQHQLREWAVVQNGRVCYPADQRSLDL